MRRYCGAGGVGVDARHRRVSPLAAYSAAVAGAAAGFLFFNFKPASIFMGDSGSLFLGGTLAVLSLMGGRQAGTGVYSPRSPFPCSSC